MTHLWAAGTEIAIQAADDAGPATFTWAGRVQRVARVCNAWRVHTG